MKRLLSLFSMLLFLLTACSGDVAPVATPSDGVTSFFQEEGPPTEIALSPFSEFVRCGEEVILAGTVATDGDVQLTQVRFQPDSGDFVEETLPFAANVDDSVVYDFIPLSGGGWLTAVYEKAGQIRRPARLVCYAADGTEAFSLPFAEIFTTEPREILSLFAYDGRFYAVSENAVGSIGADGDDPSLVSLTDGGTIDDACMNEDGVMLLRVCDVEGYHYSNYRWYRLDADAASLIPFALPEEFSAMTCRVSVGGGYDFYLSDNGAIYGWNIGEVPVRTVDLVDSGIAADSFVSIYTYMVSPRRMLTYTYDYRTRDSSQLCVYRMLKPEEVADIVTIEVAHFGAQYTLGADAVAFHRDNPELRVKLIDYTQYNTDDDRTRGAMIFQNELAAGDIPDIIQCSSAMYYTVLDPWNLAKKGLFIDLYPFFDEEFPRDNYLPCLRTPMEYKGTLPFLTTAYNLSALLGKTANFPDDTDGKLSRGELLSLYATVSEGQWLTDISPLADIHFDSFIDDDGTAHFDSEEFLTFVKLYQRYIEDIENGMPMPDYSYRIDTHAALVRDELLMTKMSMRDTITTLIDWLYMFGTDDLIYFQLLGTDYTADLTVRTAYGITKEASHPEVAWDFLKSLAGKEESNDPFDPFARSTTLPLTCTALETVIEQLADKFIFRAESSGNSRGLIPLELLEHAPGYEYWEITEDRLRIYEQLIQNPRVNFSSDTALRDIVVEELLNLVKGDGMRTAEETVKIIQSRASIYASEQN